MMDPPVFGQRTLGTAYVRRPSVYALIRDSSGRVAMVRTAEGVFLPGGGVESGETPVQALHREVAEECGLHIQVLGRLPDAVQLVYSRAEQIHFEKVCMFFAAEIEGQLPAPAHPGHELLWVGSEEASDLATHESHRWALTEATAE